MSAEPIPMVDLKAQYATLRGELEPALCRAMAETRYIMGPNVEAFEEEAADYLGAGYAISCNSGTDALHLALAALEIGPGDEVITPAFTFIATGEAIRYVGATPVFVDIDAHTFNIDREAVRAAVTERTRALLPVHLFGQPADMEALLEIADEHGLMVIEDCAQSFGAVTADGQTGTLGEAGAFSFFPSKNLGCAGDGGLVTTADAGTAERLRMLRNHGQRERYYHEIIGYNSRLDELQAVVLRHKLPHLDGYNRERRRVANSYDDGLADLDVTRPHRGPHGVHVFHQYTVLCERRDEVMEALKADGIASAIYYPVPLHKQQAFADAVAMELPNAESVSQRCLSLPIFPELDDARTERICGVIREALGG